MNNIIDQYHKLPDILKRKFRLYNMQLYFDDIGVLPDGRRSIAYSLPFTILSGLIILSVFGWTIQYVQNTPNINLNFYGIWGVLSSSLLLFITYEKPFKTISIQGYEYVWLKKGVYHLHHSMRYIRLFPALIFIGSIGYLIFLNTIRWENINEVFRVKNIFYNISSPFFFLIGVVVLITFINIAYWMINAVFFPKIEINLDKSHYRLGDHITINLKSHDLPNSIHALLINSKSELVRIKNGQYKYRQRIKDKIIYLNWKKINRSNSISFQIPTKEVEGSNFTKEHSKGWILHLASEEKKTFQEQFILPIFDVDNF